MSTKKKDETITLEEIVDRNLNEDNYYIDPDTFICATISPAMAVKRRKKAVPKWRKDGYDSGYEADVHKNTPKIDYHKADKLSYTVSHTYEPDFSWPTSDTGKPLLVETKGDPHRWDRKAFLEMYEQWSDTYEIKLLFQKEVKLPNCKKLTNVEWAKKNGIDYAVGTKIPDHWLG
ncbi:MAG: hypothetical protein HRT61_01060 [Ekhidna sp.]|nr:hypothetical protein [Ekhidna sp.]